MPLPMTRITHDVERIPYTDQLRYTHRGGPTGLMVSSIRSSLAGGRLVKVRATEPHRFEVAGLTMTKVGDGEYRATLPRGSK